MFDAVRRAIRSDPRRRRLHELLVGIHVAARGYAEAEVAAASAVRQSPRQLAEVGSQLTLMSTADVASFVGEISERAVRLAAYEGRLRGEQDRRNWWWFEPDEAIKFKNTRDPRRAA